MDERTETREQAEVRSRTGIAGPQIDDPAQLEGFPEGAKANPAAKPDGALYGRPRLYPSSDNPVPEGVRPGTVRASDGVALRTALFPHRGKALGTVLLVTGRNESIEKYFETAVDLGAAGFVPVCFDWRGQGGSERLLSDPMRGHVRSFRHYERDLDAVIDGLVLAECPRPVTIVAHSMGALVTLLRAPYLKGRIDRLVLLAPLLRLSGQPVGPRIMGVGLGLLRALGLGRLYAAGGPRPRRVPDFLTNVLTTDPRRHERNARIVLENPFLALGGPTVAWVSAALWAMRRADSSRHLASVAVPSLVVAAGDDVVVSNLAMERMVARMRNANMVTVDGARHELLQEGDRYRAQALGAIKAFAARSGEERFGASEESFEALEEPDRSEREAVSAGDTVPAVDAARSGAS